MKNLNLDKEFLKSVDFFENIMFLDSFENKTKVYKLVIDYLKGENYYLLKMNIMDNNMEIIHSNCKLPNKLNGSIIIKDIINKVTLKYNNDLILDVKELDINNKCVKYGRRMYNHKEII